MRLADYIIVFTIACHKPLADARSNESPPMHLWKLLSILFIARAGVRASVPSSKARAHDDSAFICCSPATPSHVDRLLRARSANDSDTEARAILEELNEQNLGYKLSKAFHDFNLHQDKTNLFQYPRFKSWLNYAQGLQKAFPHEGVSVIPKLTEHMGDAPLYKMVDQAMRDPQFESLARKLKEEQVQYWLDTNKQPEDVFDVYEIGKDRSNPFRNPKFAEWMTYVDKWSAKHPERVQQKTIVQMLRNKGFLVHDQFKLLTEAKTAERHEIKSVAQAFEKLFVDFLVGDQVEKLREALAWLRLDHFKLPDSSSTAMCVKLLDASMKKFPEEKDKPLKMVITRFGLKNVALMLHTAESNPETRTIAQALEIEQKIVWLRRRYTPDKVYEALALQEDGSPKHLLATWVSYVSYYYKNRSKSTQSSPARISQEIWEKLRDHGIESPVTLLKIMGLDETSELTLVSPQFLEWKQYLDDFNHHNPDQSISLIDVLLKAYNEVVVANMLQVARTDGKIEDVFTQLKTDLNVKLREKGESLEELKARYDFKF
ncbi:hypothetical protein PsorP6_017116 [Peronosclerospora sorghi]|uniref:Uncharacterized protein n=1 Tax=Peronosclerospora sorghi TaxID=230839 RepID=A0ACC0WDR7_9STRA|nr:hypothetical protein PsorP6_017116 [Peronosclerospora sorghi]